jgi:hypothetical protein
VNQRQDESFLEKATPWIGSVILLPITIYLMLNDGRIIFVDYVNLLIHEGGHGIFKIFSSRFFHALGGTLAQILIPGMFIVFYFVNRKRIALQIFLLWLGQNFINISIYAADARAQKLPLLGGKKVYHDWTYLLRETGLLNFDQEVGLFFYLLAISSFIVALAVPILLRDYKPTKINLDL